MFSSRAAISVLELLSVKNKQFEAIAKNYRGKGH